MRFERPVPPVTLDVTLAIRSEVDAYFVKSSAMSWRPVSPGPVPCAELGAVVVLVELEVLVGAVLVVPEVLLEVPVGAVAVVDVLVLVDLMPVPTFTVALPVPYSVMTEIVALPFATPVTIPRVLTFATVESLEIHLPRLPT
jgi:hypothetical protein